MVKPLIYGLVAAAGVATHLGYFNRGEHHLYVVKYLQTFLAVFTTSVAFLVYVHGEALMQAFVTVATFTGFYLGGLYISLVIYRTIFHPLNKFAGPFGARISGLWLSVQVRDRTGHKKIFKLHEEYGEFVRIGSSNLSIINPKAVTAVYGPNSKCTKSDWYDSLYPRVSLQTTRHRLDHSRRRRLWSTAFSDKAVRGYEKRMMSYQDRLLAQLATRTEQPLNITKWFNLYVFDVMGDLAFAKSFNMLESTEEHFAVKILDDGFKTVGWLLPVWAFRLLLAIPGLAEEFSRFIDYCNQRLDERMKVMLHESSNDVPTDWFR